MCAAGHRCLAVLAGEASECQLDRSQVRRHEVERAPHLQDERRIQDVLGCRAPMHVIPGFARRIGEAHGFGAEEIAHQLAIEGGRHAYPFVAPAVKPRMKKRCPAR
jgi:hypothetical protein